MLQEDKKLVAAAKENPEKFVALYDKYFAQIYRYVYRRVNETDTVHDLVSQTFYDAMSHIKAYEWRGYQFSSWLYKIAHNNVLKWYRQQSRHRITPLDEIKELSDPFVNQEEDIVRKEDENELHYVLNQLDSDEREIIRLKFFEEVTNMEIAEIMGLSPNHIGVKVFRALRKVKQLLKSN